MQWFTDARVECSMIDGWIGLGYIKARFCQNPRLSKTCLPPREGERERERDCQIAAKLIPCPHANSVVLCYYILDNGPSWFVTIGRLR